MELLHKSVLQIIMSFVCVFLNMRAQDLIRLEQAVRQVIWVTVTGQISVGELYTKPKGNKVVQILEESGHALHGQLSRQGHRDSGQLLQPRIKTKPLCRLPHPSWVPSAQRAQSRAKILEPQ